MTTLVDWLGKAEDLSISYDAGVPQNSPLLEGRLVTESDLPALLYTPNDNVREVTDASWEESVEKADRADYLIAVACGAVSGLVDIFYVGEFSLERANKWGSAEINRFVKKVADLNGFKGADLSDAVAFLEKRFPLAADAKTPELGGGLQHHLRDFSHHFSLGGLLFSLFTQFTGKVIGTDMAGAILIEQLSSDKFIGQNFEEKILFGSINWFFHMVSDMAGSSSTAGKGTGIPGPIVSLIKELSAIPCFKDKTIGETEFHTWVSKLFNGTLLAKRDDNGKILEPVKFDLRTEIGLLHEVGRQFIPVLLNECLVRGLYFLRRLHNAITETDIHSISDLQKINPSDLLPFNNRVIKRMVTVASGVFTAIDVVEAAVRAAIKNGGVNPKFFVDFAVRINIVGVGRFIVACKADASFITEDIIEAKAKRDKAEKEYEKLIADLQCLSLDFEQMRILYSIESLIVTDDISRTKKHEEKQIKRKWKVEWERKLLDSLKFVGDSTKSFFSSSDEIDHYFTLHEDGAWKYLIAMEALLFVPYFPLSNTSDEKELKKLRCNSKYLKELFVDGQGTISKKDLDVLRRTFRQSAGIVTGSTKKLVIGAVGTTALVLATGGLAFTFAPAIATALIGESAVGLSGAALVSYSLAAVGGGSLAAGGLGMAGGTAIIAGGGALIGMLSGAGVSTAATINLLSDNGYVLSECSKLLTYSKMVLHDKYHDCTAIVEIKRKIDSKVYLLEQQFNQESEASGDNENKEEKKIKGKVVKKSIRYLRNTSNALERILKEENLLECNDLMSLPDANQ